MNPRKRTDDLIVETTGDETLVYDLRSSVAHLLDADSTIVWNASDGRRDPAAIRAETGLSAEVVEVALDQLVERELVDGVDTRTRRDALRRSLVGAGIVAALPLIRSISAPEAARAAASAAGPGAPCDDPMDCMSQICTAAGVCG